MEALRKIDLKNVIYFDIETAPLVEELGLNSPMFDAFAYTKRRGGEKVTDAEVQKAYNKEASLMAEFSKIICISVGRIGKEGTLVTKSYSDSDEKTLLLNFTNDLGQMVAANSKFTIGGHHIKGFDAPFYVKRCLINGVTPSPLLDVAGKKPWEVELLCSAELWKGSGYNHTSLISLAFALGIPSPKSDINGSQVRDVYYTEGETGFKRIVKYCERDVLTTANVFRRFKFEPLLVMESTDKVEVEKEPLIINLAAGGPFEKREQAELKSLLDLVDEDDIDAALTILDAIAAKKSTKITKPFMKKLRASYE